MNKTLSIIIVNYNTRSLVLDCLRSIVAQSSVGEYEIIVVDNHSIDRSVEVIRSEFPEVVIIENDKNVGYAGAVNRGLEKSVGEFVLVLNSDTVLKKDALRKSLKFMNDQPDAGIMGCKLLNADGSLQPSCESFLSLWNIFCESFFLENLFPKSRVFGKFHMTFFGYDRIAKVDRVMGAFLMVPRKALDEIGLMDEQFFFYGEEVDWCYRAWQNGWAVYFFPGAEVVHYGGGSADPVLPALFVERHKNRFLFYRKYHGRSSSLMMRVISAMGSLFRLGLWSARNIYQQLRKLPGQNASRKKVLAYFATLRWYVGLGQGRGTAITSSRHNDGK